MASTDGNAIELRLVGDIRPQELRSHDLGEVIAAYEDAIAAVVAHQHPTVKPELVTVGLISVLEGSVALTFGVALPELVYPAALTVTKAVAKGAWEELPLRAVKPLRRILCFLQDKDLIARFFTAYDHQTERAELVPETVIPPAITLYGPTELVVEVKLVGGVEPRAVVVTLQGDTLFCETTEVIAKQLGNRLYRQVRVSGAAEWDFESLSIVAYDIAEVLPYQRVSPVEAFAALREEFGEYFDEIDDPEDWVNQNRQG